MTNKIPTIKNISERDFQKEVSAMAERLGYKVFHNPDSRKVTAVGFPDLVLMQPETGAMFFWELKSAKGKIAYEQRLWINALAHNGSNAGIFRPADLELMRELLVNGARKEKNNA